MTETIVWTNDDKSKALYRRSNSKTLYYRIKVGTKYIRRTTGLVDLDAAIKLITEFNQPLQRSGMTFGELIAMYLEKNKNAEVLHQTHLNQTIERYFLPFFAKMQVSALKNIRMDEYHEWRIQNQNEIKKWRPVNSKGRPYTEISRHKNNCTMRTLLGFAADMDVIDVIPKIRKVDVPDKKRGKFTEEQINELREFITAKAKSSREEMLIHQSNMLLTWIDFALLSGLRPAEQKLLTWDNVFINEDHVLIKVDGKTGKRSVICRDGAKEVLERCRFMGTEGHVWKYHGKETVGVLSTKLARYLIVLGMKTDSQGQQLSLYSFRHTYATNQLLRKVDIYLLARNMGTSVRMIEKHYSHVVVEQKADQLV